MPRSDCLRLVLSWPQQDLALRKLHVGTQKVSKNFGITPKTKHKVIGRLSDSNIGAVDEFPYLGSVVASSDVDVEKRLAQASKSFGALRKAVFMDRNFSVAVKRRLYNTCILLALLYDAECWIPLIKHIKDFFTIDVLGSSWSSLIGNNGQHV